MFFCKNKIEFDWLMDIIRHHNESQMLVLNTIAWSHGLTPHRCNPFFRDIEAENSVIITFKKVGLRTYMIWQEEEEADATKVFYTVEGICYSAKEAKKCIEREEIFALMRCEGV